MSRQINAAVLQMAFTKGDPGRNVSRVAEFARRAARGGAEIILPPELFSDHYFCKTQDEAHFANAYPWRDHPAVHAMQDVARELSVVIPVSIFEKKGPEYFNSVVLVDADGALLGVYRKSHIPDGPGYQEKFYFRPAIQASAFGTP